MFTGQEKLNGMSIDNLALRQLEDYDLGRPGTLFAGGIELSVDQAYALQSAVVNLRCKRGEKVIGYKVGCTSPAIKVPCLEELPRSPSPILRPVGG